MQFIAKKSGVCTSVALAAALMASSCATGPNGQAQDFQKTLNETFASDDPCSNNSRNIGMAGGALVGSLLAKAMGQDNAGSLVTGAALGATLGGLIGSDMDRRRCALAQIAKAHNLDIVMTDITVAQTKPVQTTHSAAANPGSANKKPDLVGMSFTIFDKGNQFLTGSGLPSADASRAFAEIAERYRVSADGKDPKSVQSAKDRVKKMRILLVGHTDDTGSSELNADLSEKRARAIAEVFSLHGFSADQVFYQGAGEVFPIDDNRTEVGRARNRRVEIVDLSDDASFAAFLASRRPNIAHYRPAPEAIPNVRVTTNVSGAEEKKRDQRKTYSVSAQARSSTPKQVKPSVAVVTANSKNPKVATPLVSGSSPATPPSHTVEFDFGGSPANGQYKSVDIGKAAGSGSFSIMSTAYAADDTPLGSCATDRPRISHRVKSLRTGQTFKTSEYLPGAASTSWAGKVNGHLVGLTGVSVLRDGAQPASQPTFYVWQNYAEGSKATAELKTLADVNAYQGDKALLYRVFLNEGPVRCLDVVIPNGAPNTAPSSNLVYERMNTVYQSDYSPSIVR